MGIFKPAVNQTAFLKAGILGFHGSGKTYLAFEIAIGLHKYIKATKPIMFVDSEAGSDWGIPRCKEAGIDLEVAKDKSFITLITAIEEAEKSASVLIIDSVTHYWEELQQAYRDANGIKGRMAFHHWNKIKPKWREFTDCYINSKVHIIICGRATYDWIEELDEDGISKSVKGGTKMKAEGEFGFEPNLVLETEAVKGKRKGDKYLHRVFVVKDKRMDDKTLDGKSFENPVFEDFLPHIESLNLGGVHAGTAKIGSKGMFISNSEGLSREQTQKLRASYIQEFNGNLDFHYPGAKIENKNARLALKKYIFKTYSEESINGLDLTVLLDGLRKLEKILNHPEKDKKVKGIIEELKKAKIAEDKKTEEPESKSGVTIGGMNDES